MNRLAYLQSRRGEMRKMAWKDSGIGEDDIGNGEGDFWEPDVNDVLEGDVIEEPKKGQYNKLFLKVRDSAGGIWITSQHSHLHMQIKQLEIAQGDKVRITYLGYGREPEDPQYSAPQLYKLQKWED